MAKKDPNLRKVETHRTDRFVVGDVRMGQTPVGSFLKCLQCGRTTHNPEDVMYRYCNSCHQWLDQPHHGGIR